MGQPWNEWTRQDVVTQKESPFGTGCSASASRKYLQLLETGSRPLAQHSYRRVTRVL